MPFVRFCIHLLRPFFTSGSMAEQKHLDALAKFLRRPPHKALVQEDNVRAIIFTLYFLGNHIYKHRHTTMYDLFWAMFFFMSVSLIFRLKPLHHVGVIKNNNLVSFFKLLLYLLASITVVVVVVASWPSC